MPIYEYQCQSCGYKFEQLQKMTDKPLCDCPDCEKGKLVKLVSNTSFQLKGSGWYVTDFKDKKPKDGGVSKESKISATTTKEEKPVSPSSKNDEKPALPPSTSKDNKDKTK